MDTIPIAQHELVVRVLTATAQAEQGRAIRLAVRGVYAGLAVAFATIVASGVLMHRVLATAACQ